jgi:hypothetical protein
VNDLPWAADIVTDTVRQAHDLLTAGLASRITLG